MQMTHWFSAKQKPVRSGVYMTRLGPKYHPWDGWCHWNGKRWAAAQGTARAASHYRYTASGVQDRQWRGVVPPIKAHKLKEPK